jgi:hypothetical protein
MKKFVLLSSLVFVFLLTTVLTQPVEAETLCPIVKRVLPLQSNASDPLIDGDYIVWEWYDGNDSEIVLYQISSETFTALTENDTDEFRPLISGNYVVWREGVDVIIYDIAAMEKTNIGAGIPLGIGGDYLALRIGNNQLNLYQISTETSTPIQNLQVGDVIIEGDEMVWVGSDEGDNPNVYHYKISTETLTPITNNLEQKYGLGISGDNIFWVTGQPSGEKGLFRYNLSDEQTTTINDNLGFDMDGFDVEGDWVVWAETRLTSNQQAYQTDLFLYNIVEETTTQLTNTNNSEHSPFFEDHLLFWRRNNSPLPFSGIFVRDMVTGDTSQINRTGIHLSAEGSTLVWNHWNNVEMTTCGDYLQQLTNPSFEQDNNKDNIPDTWKPVNRLGDKRMCNVDPNTIRGFFGNCGYRFKGAIGKNSILKQCVNLTGFDFTQPLTLSAWVQGKKVKIGTAKIRIKINYTDGSNGKENLIFPSGTYEYQQRFLEFEVAASKTVQKMIVQLRYNGTVGWVLYDGVYLTQPIPVAQQAWLPLP